MILLLGDTLDQLLEKYTDFDPCQQKVGFHCDAVELYAMAPALQLASHDTTYTSTVLLQLRCLHLLHLLITFAVLSGKLLCKQVPSLSTQYQHGKLLYVNKCPGDQTLCVCVCSYHVEG